MTDEPSNYTSEDVDAAREYLESQKVEIGEMEDDAIVVAAIAQLDKASEKPAAETPPLSPGEPKETPEPEATDVADLKKKLKAGDGAAILKAFEDLSSARAQDQQTIQAIGAALGEVVTKQVGDALKGEFPEMGTKKGRLAVQEKAAVLLKTGEYELEEAIVDAAGLLFGKKASAPTKTEQTAGLEKLRALKSGGGPATKTLRAGDEPMTYDEWSDKIGALVIEGHHDKAKALRERGFTEKK